MNNFLKPFLHRGRIRHPWAPDGIPDLTIWYDAAAIEGLSNGDPIDQWDDLSANDLHITSGPGNKPTYFTNERNGLPAVTYNSTKLSRLSVDHTLFDPTEVTIYVVGYHDSVARNDFFQVTTPNLTNINVLTSHGDNEIVFAYGSGGTYSISTTLPGGFANNWHYQELRRTGVQGEIYNDGSLLQSGTFSTSLSPTGDFPITVLDENIGTKLAELIIYTRALSTSERAEANNYIQTKWGF